MYFENFLDLIYDNNPSTTINSALELLNFYSIIAQGFNEPFKEEHAIFFKEIIINLYKIKIELEIYETQILILESLSNCTMIFLRKESSLALLLLETLLNNWPIANYRKEILFLQELSLVVEVVDLNDSFNNEERIVLLITKLFKRLRKCISIIETYFEMAYEAMTVIQSEGLLRLIKKNKKIAFQVLVPEISYGKNFEYSRGEWAQ